MFWRCVGSIIMKFAIQINGAPYQGQASDSAYQFIRAALRKGHEIVRVFFYHDGIYNGLRHAMPPEDERPIVGRWSTLAREHGVDLVICISAAQRRGLLSGEEAQRAGKVDQDLAEGFRLAGLGLWVDACLKADRFMVFGG
jgi:tRNA 2-thiouridine synthesizing protein D